MDRKLHRACAADPLCCTRPMLQVATVKSVKDLCAKTLEGAHEKLAGLVKSEGGCMDGELAGVVKTFDETLNEVTPDGYRPQSPWLRGQTQCTQEAAGGVSAVKNIRCYSSARYVLPGGSSADVKAEFKAAFGTELPCLDQEAVVGQFLPAAGDCRG